MRVFIPGTTGFIGRHVMEVVNEVGHDILALTLEKDKIKNSFRDIQWLFGNLADLESLKPAVISFNPDVVIHLAWQGIPDYSESISRMNLNNSIDLLDFILNKTNCRKIIVSGSCWEYGKKMGECKESDTVQITSFFSWAKHSLYQYLLLKCNKKDIDLIWFRIFYVYGPGQRGGSLIPTLVQLLKAGKIPDIRTPLNKNDFVYVKDVARAFQLAVDVRDESGIYNIGYGASNSVYDVCRIVENQMCGSTDISSNILNNGSKEQSVNFWANMDKTKDALNWAPQITLEMGIAKYIESLK